MAVVTTTAALVLGVAAAILAGCSGMIETRKLSPQAMADTDHWVDGLIVYQPAMFVEISSKTTLVDGGKLKGSSADNPPACIPVQSEKTVALPDLKNPYQIRYNPGLFDSNTFAVTLQSGTVESVNGNVSGALHGASPGASNGSGGGGLAALPIPIPLSSPAAPPDGFATIPAIERIQPRSGIRRIQLHPSLPSCNDGPVILGYRWLSLP